MIITPPPPHSSLSPLCTFSGADPIGGAWLLGLGAGRDENERFSLGGFARVVGQLGGANLLGGWGCDSYDRHLAAGLGGSLEQKTPVVLSFFNVLSKNR